MPAGPRIGLRAGVLTISALLVAAAAFAVSSNVSDHLAQAAIHESVRTTEALLLGSMDPPVSEGAISDPAGPPGQAINARLARLVATGKLLRVKVWDTKGTILFSDLAALRGAHFEIDEDLGEALDGEVATEIGPGDEPENAFEAGLAAHLLSIYLPIRGADGVSVIGAYEIYEDAAPILADIATTRTDVILITGAMALGLLALLYAAFAGASRRLGDQNRRLRDQAATEQALMVDLRRSEERFRSLLRNSVDVNVVFAPDGTIAYESPAVERVLGWKPEQRVGTTGEEQLHPDDVERLRQLFFELVEDPGGQVSAEARIRHADGSYRLIEIVGRNLLADPAVGGIVANYRDISERRSLEDELRHQAFHDSLTGLANRALFADRLEHALSRTRRSRHRLAVLFLDLDDFKTINDSLGHSEGDQLLIAVAERLRDAIRAGDTIARMGGDEFAVLVEDAANGSPMEVAERLQATLQAPFQRGGKELFVHASVGVAVSTPKETPEELLRNADASMYMAKSHGKNRIEVFEPSMHHAATARLALKGDLERAVERAEFELVYQPIVTLARREVVGVEALLRWRHPERGLVLPTEFIAVAEETGMILPIGAWVLEQACRQARGWEVVRPNRPLSMSVNVSGRQVAEPGFVRGVAEILASTGLAADRLVLEFTEGVLMRDTDMTTTTLADLKALGVKLAIDDFGTGFSSLNYLRTFPIDILKIDGSFVASMSLGQDQRAVVRAILRLGETLHLSTIAEGIEDAGQLADLRALGATLGQGYFFARALTAEEISVLLQTEEARPARLSIDRFVA
jgi:diguanylate cyclase (GGDEF)-like protein/PAS domain S-box-containing protein